jgi:hypothetical protein
VLDSILSTLRWDRRPPASVRTCRHPAVIVEWRAFMAAPRRASTACPCASGPSKQTAMPKRRLIANCRSQFGKTIPDVVGQTVSQVLEKGPEHDQRRAFPGVAALLRYDGPDRSWISTARKRCGTTSEAWNCHPCFHSPSACPALSLSGGRRPAARSTQRGLASHPCPEHHLPASSASGGYNPSDALARRKGKQVLLHSLILVWYRLHHLVRHPRAGKHTIGCKLGWEYASYDF